VATEQILDERLTVEPPDKPAHKPFPKLAEAIRAQTEGILSEWRGRMLFSNPDVAELTRKEFRDGVAEILSTMADALESNEPADLRKLIKTAPEHGFQRFMLEYDLVDVFAEERILRRVIVERVEEELDRQCDRDEASALHTMIDLMLQQGIVALVLSQADQQHRNEDRFRAITNATSDVVYTMSPDWKEMRLLRGREFIIDTLEPNAAWLDKYIYPEDQQGVMNAVKSAIESKSPFELEHRVIRVDGALGWTHSRAVPIFDERGEIVEWIGAASDITEERKAKEDLRNAHDLLEERVIERTEELRRALARLVDIQEEERRRIGRNIHDHLGQQITALRINLTLLTESSRVMPELCDQLERVTKLASQIDDATDAVIWELRPSDIDEVGLETSLKNLVDSWAAQFGIEAELYSDSQGDARLSTEIKVQIYRITQEALHNIFKHAKATTVSIVIDQQPDTLRVVIEDNGIGFAADSPKKADRGGGLGLVSMRERAALVGGTVEFESEPGSGTTVIVEIPTP
jgi:signal transduction histidine kinase